jgi:signal transduction histidine kinase/CheY-like chemotaxis protein
MRVFTARDTGVATMAWSAAQDASGRMYFGCDTVLSFDGERWRQEKMDATYLVRGLDIGPNGRIWTVGVNQIGWFEPGKEGRLQYHSLMPSLPPGTSDLGDVWRVYAQGNEGAIFVAREKILRWDGKKMESWEYPGMHLLWSTRTPKAVYVHYPPQGLLRIGDSGPTLVLAASVLGASEVRWLDDSGEDWLLLTSQGFKTLHKGVCTPVESEASAFVRANVPTSVARLADGTLAIGTLQGGIALVERSGRIRRVLNLQAGLPANQIYSLFADRDGALWAMGPSHIVRLALESGTAVYDHKEGYPPGGCPSLAEFSGEIYAVSHSDFFRLSADPQSGGAGQFTPLGLTSSRFYSLLPVSAGLAVGDYRGLALWSPLGLTPSPRLEDIVFRLSASASGPGTVLASLFDRVLRVDPSTGASSVVADSLPNYGDSVVEERSGRLWIATPSRGIFVALPRAPRSAPASPTFGPLPSVGPSFVALAGTSVIALTKGGGFFLDPRSDRFRPISGFPTANPIAVSNADASGDVWAALDPDEGGHSPRLGRISVQDGVAQWTPQSVEGLAQVGSILSLRVETLSGSEDLWVSGTEALLRAAPAALSPHPPPRRPMMRASVRADNGAESALTGPLPYATRGLRIEYSSLDFGRRESERFQTMLFGAENEWSPPTDSADRDLSGLHEGSYTFMARVVTDSGEAGEAAALPFRVSPPWWRTPLWRAVFLLAAAAGILAILRLRTRALKRRARVLERMVRVRTDELEKANAAKNEFVASMSHEIRNPMGGIMASALELSQTPLAPEQLKLVTNLSSCASFLASLVEDVLDFAAIEAGAYTVTIGAFSPRDVLENVAKMLAPKASGARMDVTVDPALPALIRGDIARIQQVVVNFAANALKFGGRNVVLSVRPEGDQVVFSVTDDGIGISPEDQKNLFIRFSRLKSARNSAVPGTGLGLAVSRALAERLGGSVAYCPALGGGSTFVLRLPLEAGAADVAAPHPFDAGGAKALVVEDIDYNARTLGLMLGRLGFKVEIAQDGEDALARLGAGVFQVVFLDCNLPRINGIEVARRFRMSEGSAKRALLVATTALSTVEDRNRCVAAGMDAFMTKPITPEKLRGVLTDHGGFLPAPAAAEPGRAAPEIPGIRLELILHLANGSPGSLRRELGKFQASLDGAMRGVSAAQLSGSRQEAASAAHRVLSLAKMVGADALASTAADIQDYASVYTEAEFAQEIAILGRRATDLRNALARAGEVPLSPSGAF